MTSGKGEGLTQRGGQRHLSKEAAWKLRPEAREGISQTRVWGTTPRHRADSDVCRASSLGSLIFV